MGVVGGGGQVGESVVSGRNECWEGGAVLGQRQGRTGCIRLVQSMTKTWNRTMFIFSLST